MMNVILDLLDTRYGTLLNPEKDGRLEITQTIIRSVGLNKCESLFAFDIPGGLLISGKRNKSHNLIRRLKLSGGRLRIPMGVLKQFGFVNKKMRVVVADENLIVRPDNSKNIEKCKDILENLSQLDKEKLSQLLLGNSLEQPEVKPSLFLLDRGTAVFRPIGMPIWFCGSWVGDELVVDGKSNTKISLLPGIMRSDVNGTFNIGFLLLLEKTVLEVARAINRVKGEARDLIFIYRQYYDGFYSVHCNPPTRVSEERMELALEVCSNVQAFIRDNFREIEDTDVIKPMPVILPMRSEL